MIVDEALEALEVFVESLRSRYPELRCSLRVRTPEGFFADWCGEWRSAIPTNDHGRGAYLLYLPPDNEIIYIGKAERFTIGQGAGATPFSSNRSRTRPANPPQRRGP